MTLVLSVLLLLAVDSTPRHGDTILFVGDSITQAGDYVADVEAFLLACRPSDFFRVINVGKSSETVSGTSEPDHHPPRPCIHDRFARDVAAFKPNVVVACYGMNDGNYFPFDVERFEKYKAGMTRFVERVFKETPARALVLLTPPAFDASRAPPPPADGKSFGYKHPSPHYDEVLRKYSDWLLTLKSERVCLVDVHRAFNLIQRGVRERGRPFTLSPDAVHPDGAGHWIIAQSLLSEWKLRPKWKTLTLDLSRPRGWLNWDVVGSGQGLEIWTWRTPPIEPPLDELLPYHSRHSQRVAQGLVAEELFDQRFRVTGLPARLYEIEAFGGTLREVEGKALKKGVGLLHRDSPPRGMLASVKPPAFQDAKPEERFKLLDLVAKRRARISAAWLAAQKDKPFTDLKLSIDAVAKGEEETRDLTKAITDALKPRSYLIRVMENRYQP
jgi:lysophospholipase L1-like esterase